MDIEPLLENSDINKKLNKINLYLDNFKIEIDKLLLNIIETNFKDLFLFKIQKSEKNPFIKLNELYTIFKTIIHEYSNINKLNRKLNINLKLKEYVSNFTIIISAYFTYNEIINTCIQNHGNEIIESFFIKYLKDYIENIYSNNSEIPKEQQEYYNLHIKKLNLNYINYHFIIYNYNLIFNKNSIKKALNYYPTGVIMNFDLKLLIFDLNLMNLNNEKYNIKNIIFLILYTINENYSTNINSKDYVTIPQYREICWFISILTGMCYSDLSKKLLLTKQEDIKRKYNINHDHDINDIFTEKKIKQENIKDFICFIYYIIENLTNKFKTYNDFLIRIENKDKLNILLNLFKNFPLKFLSSMSNINISKKRKSSYNSDIRELIKDTDQKISELKLKSELKSESKIKSNIELLKKNKLKLENDLISMLVNGIHDENYFWLNIKNEKYGANLFSYNIIVEFYEYFDIKVLFLYLDTKTNKFYVPKNTASLENIHDYDIIIISKFNIDSSNIGIIIEDTESKIKLFAEIFIDIKKEKYFEDIDIFTENFNINHITQRINIKPDFTINNNKFELDYILHSTDESTTCNTCVGHCISSITYNGKLYSYNSMYSIFNTDVSQYVNKDIKIPCNLIENNWKQNINSNNCYNIKKCYYENYNHNLNKIALYSDPTLFTYCYDKKIRYVYIKNNNIEQTKGGN